MKKKLRKIKFKTWTKKKSYNPFKMWGSWVGAFIALLIGLITIAFGIFTGNYLETVGYRFILLTFGFLIGWGIHSLIRRYK